MGRMSDDETSFRAFMRRRDAAARAYVSGDVAPLREVTATRSPATFFGPGGGHVAGADEVLATYMRDAARFASGESRFEILHMGASGGLAYWVGYQRAASTFDGREVPFDLRVTEIFRREGDDWKMIHRHADMLAEAQRGGT